MAVSHQHRSSTSSVDAAPAASVISTTLTPATVAALRRVEQHCAANGARYEALRAAGTRPELPRASQPFVARFRDTDAEPMTWFHTRTTSSVPLPKLGDALAKLIRSLCVPASVAEPALMPMAVDPSVEPAETAKHAAPRDTAERHVLAALALVYRYERATGLPATALMLHRLFVAAFVVACKSGDDFPPSFRVVSSTTGLRGGDIVRLENELVRCLDWRVVVSDDDIDALPAYCRHHAHREPAVAPAAHRKRAASVSPARGSVQRKRSSALLGHSANSEYGDFALPGAMSRNSLTGESSGQPSSDADTPKSRDGSSDSAPTLPRLPAHASASRQLVSC